MKISLNSRMISSVTRTDDKPVTLLQWALPFAPRIDVPSPFIPSSAQEEAGDLLLRHLSAKVRGTGLTTVLLTGPQGAGKSRLLEEVAAAEPDLRFQVLDVDDAAPMNVFAAINKAAAERSGLVLEGCGPVHRWFETYGDDVPPDLHSRLGAAPHVRLDRPSALAVSQVLAADTALHGHSLREDELLALAEDLPRDLGAPRRFCQALDRADRSLNRRALLRWALERAHVRLGDTNPEGPST